MRVERFGRRALLCAAGAASVGFLAGCLGSSPDETIAVGADGEPVFEPRTLEVARDSLVEFAWESVPELAEDFEEWNGVPEPAEEGFSLTKEFVWEGTYEFTCREHGDDMTGLIEVVE